MAIAKVATFRERFSELFAESEKTNTDLSKDLHVSNQTISAWRIGTRSPKEPTIISIASHFGVSVEWLMGFDVPRKHVWAPPKTEEARAISEIVDKLDKHKRAQALKIILAIYKE